MNTTMDALTSDTGADTTYYAVRGQDYDTCSALGWVWMSIRPMVLASGPDAATVLGEAVDRAGHDDVRLHEVSL